jgi:YD repeat-containing protein
MGALASRGGGRWLLLAVLVAAGFVGLALDGSRSSAEDAAQQAAQSRTEELLAGAEPVASLATETSKTYRRPDGKFVTRIFSQPADADASLTPAAGGGYDSDGHGATTHFPSSLADPVKVTRGDAWVSTQLVDGAGTGTPSGSSITYADALPGVAVTYRASEGAVGEDLHLNAADAPSRYVFEVEASAGVRAATQPNGTIAMIDADGSRVLSLSPSFAFADRDPDVTQKVTTTLSELDGGGWRVVLSVDEKWLRQALADGPVTIDPTVELQGASRDCALTSDTPTLSFCANSQLWVGWSGDHDHHSLVKWDVSAIPKDALVLSGDAGLYQSGSTVPVTKAVTLHRVTRDWTNGASWNTYDGTHAWTTAGGDYDPAPAASQNDPAYNNGWIDWYPTALVQRWVDGSLPNYGVVVKDQSPPHVTGEEDFLATEGTTAASAPELDIIWTTRGGAPDPYTFESQGIDAKTTAAVNAANGNLQLTTKDIAIAGQGGLNLAFNHAYNSIADPTIIQGVGLQTTGSLGRDVSLQPLYGPDVVFSRGDGLQVAFSNPQTTGATKTFTTPADLPGATLTQSTTTSIYTLDLPSGLPAWPGLHQILTFSSGGALTQLADTLGHHLAFTYDSGGYTNPPALDGITDTNNAYYDVDRASPTGNESVDNIATPSDTQHWTFAYDPSFGTLTKATSIDNTNYQYAYDSAHRLSKITGPTGAVTLVTYNGATPKVASIIQTTNTAHTTGPTTTFTYSSPTTPCLSTSFDYQKTVVQRPNSTSTTYCSNDHAQITYDTDNPTTATPSGEWYDLHDQYTKATGTHSITVAGADAGAGVKKLSLERGSGTEIASTTLPCDPRNAVNPMACPHTATRTASFDPSAFPEGAQAFHVRTTDYAGRTTVSPGWLVNIDRTAAGLATNAQTQVDASTSIAAISWDDATDPALPDGTPGSGTASYQYRYARGAGAWSSWQSTDYDGFTLPSSFAGEVIALDVRSVDAVGNVGADMTTSVTATTPPLDTTAPVLSLSDIEAGYGSADSKTLVDWKAADDPDFADGYVSTGVAGYNVRYRRDGGAWSGWSTVTSSRILLSGGHVGEAIVVEVSAFDGAGNTSAVKSASTTAVSYSGAAGTLACWPSDDGIPPDCNDASDVDEANGGPTASLTPVVSTGRQTADASTGLSRYYIRVKGLWTTARLRPRSYVVGNVKDGWTLDRVGDDAAGYAFGTIRGAFQGCGWIQATYDGPYAHNGTSNCTNLGDIGLPKLATIAQQVNPLRTSGSDTVLKSNQANGVKFCAYINPWPGVTGSGHQCGGVYKKVTFAQLSASGGYHVGWRYVTLDGKWVLVQDSDAAHHNDGYATINWWFVRRSAFNVLCVHPRFSDSPGGPSCAPTN